MLLAAPTRFSTTNCWPSRSDSHCAISRVARSPPPPGAKPTTKRTGRVGYACALAIRDTVGSAAAPAARCRNVRRGSFNSTSHLSPLFNHLVGEREQLGRNFDAECLCGGDVDDQIEFSPEFDRQIAGLFALENPADVDTGAAISIRLTWSVADQAANLSVLA